MTIEFTEV
jgi:hypothetical protein